jgi:uncharacterized protein
LQKWILNRLSERFEQSILLDADRDSLHRYHARPGALQRLIPPWENVRVLDRSDSLEVGSKVVIENRQFGLPLQWHAKHTAYHPPHSFQDLQESGPFKTFIHDHHFEEHGNNGSKLKDSIEFAMKFGPMGKLGLPFVQQKLEAMFSYRHQTTKADLRLESFLKPFVAGRSLRIGVSGSSGMIGRRVVDLISVLGHQPIRILRSESRDSAMQFPLKAMVVKWDVRSGFQKEDRELIDGLDAVIHLAGKGIADARWTQNIKSEIRASRVEGTVQLVQSLVSLPNPPKAFVSASGVGVYGDCGDRLVGENTAPGADFLADLARDWEKAAMTFASTGRVAIGRLGIALHPRAGALAKMLLPFQLGIGGPMGRGNQYWSWVHVDDAAAAFLYLAINPQASGPYNLVAPEQTTNREFSRTLAKVLARPCWLPASSFALRLALGEMADAMLLSSTRANGERLVEDGFPLRGNTLEGTLRHLLGR